MNEKDSAQTVRGIMNFQFEISWTLLEYHLGGIKDEECFWRPGQMGPHVYFKSGVWQADWPDSESYDIGPASIAWLTWHIIFWWSMALDYAFGNGKQTREEIIWPGSIAAAKEEILSLSARWKSEVDALPDRELFSCVRTRWPFADRPFYELAAWLNLELMKNASEIGYCRFLYASQGH